MQVPSRPRTRKHGDCCGIKRELRLPFFWDLYTILKIPVVGIPVDGLIQVPEIECYVSNTGQRLISMRAAVKSIANNDSGGLAEYIGANALKSYINKDLVLAELTELDVPN